MRVLHQTRINETGGLAASPRELLTLDEAAKRAGISVKTLYRMRKNEGLPTHLGKRVDAAELELHLAERGQTS